MYWSREDFNLIVDFWSFARRMNSIYYISAIKKYQCEIVLALLYHIRIETRRRRGQKY